MKFKELQALSQDALAKKEVDVRMELIKQNAQVATGTAPKSPGQISQLKKTLARIKMINSQPKEVNPKDA